MKKIQITSGGIFLTHTVEAGASRAYGVVARMTRVGCWLLQSTKIAGIKPSCCWDHEGVCWESLGVVCWDRRNSAVRQKAFRVCVFVMSEMSGGW